jgi:hypothetical protein
LAAGVPPVAVFVGWRLAASHLPPVDGRLSALAVLAPALALTVLLSWLLARAAGSLDAYDVDVLKSLGRRSSA